MQRVLTSAFLIIAGTMYIFLKEMRDGEVTARDTTMCFTTFVCFDMFNALSCRSADKSIFQIGFLSNKMFLWAVCYSFFVLSCLCFSRVARLACLRPASCRQRLRSRLPGRRFDSKLNCRNPFFLSQVGGSLFGQLLVIYFPPLQGVFQTEALYLTDILFIIVLTSSVFWVDEFRKRRAQSARVAPKFASMT